MMDCQKIENGLQVTDIGTSALHMVGYLGKNLNSAEVTPDGYCPACKKIGLMRRIRKYHINFEESIFLCENPQCIYPLGSASLSTIIIPSDAKGYSSQSTCGKRKLLGTNLLTSSIEPCLKLIRTDDLMDAEETFRSDLIPNCNGNNLIRTRSGQSDFSQAKQPSFSEKAESINQKMGSGAEEHSSEVLNVQAQLSSASEMAPSVSQVLQQRKPSLREPLWLQWRNAHALCWLDCILSILVHLETLRILTGISKNTSIIQSLLTKYNEAAVVVNTCQRDELASEVPLDVLSRAESHLNEIRNTVFVQLQPLLGCKFDSLAVALWDFQMNLSWLCKNGEEESPVFAFPLLLREDRHIENLFLHSFSWTFECLQCGYHTNNSCQRTMTTFTNIIPEWHPLNAVHVAPCNKCNHTSQRRKMVLEKISSVLMMHFVEGLPHNNLMAYSFQFQEYSYQVTAVVQYQKAQHFITWILTSDGIWLECDDLKGSFSRRHHTFGVPSAEIHIVIWERKPPQITNYSDLQVEETVKAQSKTTVKYSNDETADSAPLTCQKAVHMVNTHIEEIENLVSNQKNSLLHGLGNLSDDDVVTLDLDLGGQLLEGKYIENKQIIRTGPLQLQELDEKDVCPLTPEGDIQKRSVVLANTSAPMHEGQPSDASNLVTTPSVALSNGKINFSSEILLSQVSLVPAEESSNCHPKNPQKKTSKTKLGNPVSGVPNVVEFGQEIKIRSHVSAPSSQSPTSQSSSTNGIKPSVASWVNGLLGKYSSFMPKSVLVPNKLKNCKKSMQKETNTSSLVRQAGHFCGFQTKSSQKSKMAALDSSNRTQPTSPMIAFSVANTPVKNLVPDSNGEAVTKRSASLDAFTNQDLLKNNHHGNQNLISVENTGSFIDKTHQLRLTLLQQLKAKKEKLASLDKLVKAKKRHKSSSKKAIKDQTKKQMEPLQTSVLYTQEMQTDVWDSKSVNSPSTDMSQCSSSNYDDILSELLLSPATTIGSLEFPQEEECRYLEMGDGSSDMPISIDQNTSIQAIDSDLSYFSPLKENGLEDHRDPSAIKSPLKKLDFESSAKQDLLDDLFSCSLNSVMANTEDLHHFDESLLAW